MYIKDKPSTSHASSTAKHPKLFEESSSEESDEEKNQLSIINRHVGKKGEKLMKMEARFNSDSRFHLDEKFISSGSEDEENDEVTQERSKNLELLSKVLGSTVKPQKKTLKTSKKEGTNGLISFRPFTRFDPFNEEHVKWVQKEEAAAKEDEKKDESDEGAAAKEDEKKDESDGEPANESNDRKDEKGSNVIHYEMQADFAEELKARLAGQTAEDSNDGGKASGFSFLAMMGRAAPSATSELKANGVKEENILANKKMKKIFANDEEMEEEKSNGSNAKVAALAPKLAASTTKFFVTGDEPHLQSLVSNFKRTQSLEKIVPRWANQRDVFAKNYKHLRKMALRKNRQELLHENGHAASKGVDKKGRSFPTKRKAES
ncbi:unnamed protein product [Strongylus vulgaris]|uniref:Uncharacterized protein n=1 Tax=Strongylus vulgaris TaxID=40348 RepID=A0A3P7IED5_STRVU|nr:unnamed protein product [Strongylus vulgaris]